MGIVTARRNWCDEGEEEGCVYLSPFNANLLTYSLCSQLSLTHSLTHSTTHSLTLICYSSPPQSTSCGLAAIHSPTHTLTLIHLIFFTHQLTSRRLADNPSLTHSLNHSHSSDILHPLNQPREVLQLFTHPLTHSLSFN